LIVPAAAGNSVDILARMIGHWLSERLGQPFVIENMPGAGGNIGTEAVARAPADGYTLLYIAAGAVINPSLYTKLNFDFLRDIAPVAGVTRAANVLVVNQSFPAEPFVMLMQLIPEDQFRLARHRNLDPYVRRNRR
jgi:tripartite-type tricarboxylate transporter receptor subunit TctC